MLTEEFKITLKWEIPPKTDLNASLAKTINEAIEAMWIAYDKDKSGYLSKAETKTFTKDILKELGEAKRY